MKRVCTSLLFILLTCFVSYGQNSIDLIQIKTDSLFNSNQIISILALPKTALNRYGVEFNYRHSELKTTSFFGKSKNAVAAINGGFFDMDNGGSVTYFEVNDTTIKRTKSHEFKWAKPDSLINGAVVISKDSDIRIEQVQSEQFYEHSKQESAILVSGPLLLFHSKTVQLPDMKFVKDRHPRTCLCTTTESLLFITIDGRNKDAEGMNLIELQQFLHSIECVDAINLDGGGSTTMWTRDKGIVNFPSDTSGERPVANALLILDKPVKFLK